MVKKWLLTYRHKPAAMRPMYGVANVFPIGKDLPTLVARYALYLITHEADVVVMLSASAYVYIED